MKTNLPHVLMALLACCCAAHARADEPASNDIIEINMVGILEMDIFAIGGETTGTIIRAGNITFEVDLGDDPSLSQRAREFHKKRVRLKGTLTKKAGVEIPERWIVVATSIGDAAKPAHDANANDKGFSQITIHLSGGFAGLDEVRLVDSDGNVSNTKQVQRVTETWKIPVDQLKEIHKLVSKTDWTKLERTVRDPNVADGFTYEFTIDTGKKKYHFTRDENGLAKDAALAAIDRLSKN